MFGANIILLLNREGMSLYLVLMLAIPDHSQMRRHFNYLRLS